MIHLQSSVLLFGLVLNKERKRAEVARGLAFHIFVLLSGAQGAFYQPFSLLILKQVNYDPGASSASWHLRLSHCGKKSIVRAVLQEVTSEASKFGTPFQKPRDWFHVLALFGMTNTHPVPTCL